MDNFGMQPPTPAKKTLGPPTQLYLPPRDNKKKTLIIVACVYFGRMVSPCSFSGLQTAERFSASCTGNGGDEESAV